MTPPVEWIGQPTNKTKKRKKSLDLRTAGRHPRATRERVIGLLLNHAYAYDRRILRGIVRFAGTRPHWGFVPIEPEIGRAAQEALKRADVAILDISCRHWCDLVRKVGTPVVNVGCVVPGLPVPRVGVDNLLVGEMAARHFLERGFQTFAFMGHSHFLFSIEREEGFRQALTRAGHDLIVHHSRSRPDFDVQACRRYLDANDVRWLASLPCPTGLLVEGDKLGMEVIEACGKAGIRVPDDVAVLGVTDDNFHCEITRPPMSSVIVPSESIGMRAAELADRHLKGRRPVGRDVLLAPPGITVRKSTDVLAIDDRDVAAAIRFIRDSSHHPLQVSDVLKEVQVSRRWLERKVYEILGTTLGAEIRRNRLERAKRLLRDTGLPIARVAVLAGFRSFRQLADTFRKTIHQTPTQFRRHCRESGHE